MSPFGFFRPLIPVQGCSKGHLSPWEGEAGLGVSVGLAGPSPREAPSRKLLKTEPLRESWGHGENNREAEAAEGT